MLDSVRARLALWHTAVLGVLLTGFALAAYAFLASTTARGAQEYLANSAAAFALELRAERLGAVSDTAAIGAAVAEFRVQDLGVVIYDAAGRRITMSTSEVLANRSPRSANADSNGDPSAPVNLKQLSAAVARTGTGRAATFTLRDTEGGYRVIVTPVPLRNHAYAVAMVQSRHSEAETLDDARLACVIAIPVMLLGAGVGGSFLAKRSFAPVADMSERAARISAANLEDRLPVGNPRDELGQLAGVLNQLLSRVDRAFAQQRRFMADASHELRTPVSIMRAEAEVALSADIRSPREYRESLGVVGDTAARLSTVVNELFLLARADAGQQPLRRETLYLDELVAECARAVRALASRSGVTIRMESNVDAPYVGDDELLRRLVTNLLDNAVKYSGLGSTVFISLADTGDAYRISVRDTGPGIPADAQPHLFERFFRADVARSRAISGTSSTGGGAGLGLAIAQWVAQAHGGRVLLASSTSHGTEFVVSLPHERSFTVASQREELV
ncbi:MAG: sensor histidine kinase [Gemmatimonadaceae bacterium]